jgi:hypothetical protein
MRGSLQAGAQALLSGSTSWASAGHARPQNTFPADVEGEDSSSSQGSISGDRIVAGRKGEDQDQV